MNSGMGRHKPTLLVVDDEPEIASFLTEVANDLGFETHSVLNGDDFAGAFNELEPSTIILDLNLPDTDGIELMRYMAECKAQSSIFIVSGSDRRTLAAANAIAAEYRLNIKGVIGKPLDLDDLEEKLSPILSEHNQFSRDAIHEAIHTGAITAFYQPKMDLTGAGAPKMIGVELLCRWLKPDGGIYFPDQFLPAVGRNGLMFDMTQKLFEQALHDMNVWQANGLELNLSFNLDGSIFEDLSLPDQLATLAAKYSVPAHRLTMEVTETKIMADALKAMDITTRIRLRNFNISIDDFGTGYSSFVQLYRLPFNELKIDKSFVMDIGENPEASVIVQTLVSLGKNLGLKVCAEGIETEEALNFLRDCECDTGQGYYFSKAISAEAIMELDFRG